MSAIPTSGRMPDFDPAGIKTVDDAIEAIRWLDQQIANMEGQVEHRQAQRRDDPVWLSRVHLALKRAKDHRQACYQLRGRLSRAERLSRQRELERAFMDAALRVMTPDQVRATWSAVEVLLPKA